ncbi:CMGC/MAPK protein kinase [Salpingoeca rosetta]|uniref:CMGC/MAPK protein kinase n=1 Tax=Salpingoeca rosetta (strain ATCC 50818 / BSB-021) TaxID=946362 RepID=F2UG75_SALR5|nr:CMGC/MAPK protein kinase [Salpingoeca rosetta]EGD75503.1 CMGC/MAPK protein kinase [Salpingoeca rosetta]|eukprot:XP_004991960.1 CMGC/MAPK protein kinase [Salpingoeca rosetta]
MADDESTEEKTTTAPAAPPAAVVQGGGGDDGQLVAEEDVMDQEMQQIMRGMSHMRSCDSEEAGESDRPNPFVSVAKRVPETDSTVYTLLRFNMGFHLPNKYAPPNGNVALGAFAKVVFSRDLTRPPTPVDDYQFEGHSQQVAIKKLRRFHDADEALRAYRELLILRHLREHDNIVALRDFFLLPGDDSLLDYYIVTEYCGNTLDQVMLGDLDPMDVQMIAYSILRGVKYIHSAGLTHRDLKPNNVLIDVDTVKIIDFGYAKRDRGRFPYMQAYMQCRDYRAPELFLWLQLDFAHSDPLVCDHVCVSCLLSTNGDVSTSSSKSIPNRAAFSRYLHTRVQMEWKK